MIFNYNNILYMDDNYTWRKYESIEEFEIKDDRSVKWILTMMTYLLMMNIEIHLFDIEQGLKKLPELYEIVKLIERYKKLKNREDYEKLRKFFNEDNHPLF